MKPEVGKWYIVKGYENRGPGKMMGITPSGSFGIEHKEYFGGHDFNGKLPKGQNGHCWIYDVTELFTEVPNPTAKPITEFKSGHWYRWIGPKVRPEGFSLIGEMDFILDGKPHKCREEHGVWASFYDRPKDIFTWSETMQYIIECDPPEEKKTCEHNSVDALGRVKPIMIEPMRIDLHAKDALQKAMDHIVGSKLSLDVSGMFLSGEYKGNTEVKKTKILSRAQRRKDVLSRLKID